MFGKFIGKRIRKLRKKKGLNQKQFVDLLGSDTIDQITISRWENGRRFPRPENVDLILSKCEVSIEEFLTDETRDRILNIMQELIDKERLID